MEIHNSLGFDLKRVFSGSENTSFVHVFILLKLLQMNIVSQIVYDKHRSL